jgi:SAM-dependent methyltransferase
MNNSLFLSIDPEFYGRIYEDLQGKTNDELLLHYQNIGEIEGRAASPFSVAKGLLSVINPGESVLEIGPFANPLTRGKGVKYFDIMDRKSLVKLAQERGYSTVNIPEIDFVSENGDLSIVEDKSFDILVSRHCIEHQPDLVEHLNQASRILKSGGLYLLMIPDKRYCFDHFLTESSIADVVQAHFEKRTSHNLSSLIKRHLLLTHNDYARHWAGDHGPMPTVRDARAISRVLEEYSSASGTYIDVHAWQFTPRSFLSLIEQLHHAELVTLMPRHVFGTTRNSNTFCAVLCNA